MDCGRCCKVECKECQKVDEEIREIQMRACSDDCNCLCVMYRPHNKNKVIDVLDDNLMIECGENKVEVNIIKALRKMNSTIINSDVGKLLDTIDEMKAHLTNERIQYKAEKTKLENKVKALSKDLDSLKKLLKDKFII